MWISQRRRCVDSVGGVKLGKAQRIPFFVIAESEGTVEGQQPECGNLLEIFYTKMRISCSTLLCGAACARLKL